jgi:hypothetical protein
MTGFVIFIFGAVIVGAGAMLSPAYPTSQPRIGLAGALALALIMGGAVFYGTAFGWDTLVVDYMLFVLVVGIFLGGTLSYGQKRAEDKGEELLDADQGWPGFGDMVGLLGVFVAFAILTTAAPPAQADLWAASAEQIKAGAGLYVVPVAPGAPVLAAYLSHQLGESTAQTLTAIAVVVAGLLAWVAYDFGAELLNKHLGRRLAVGGAGLGLIFLLVGQIGLLMATLWLSVMGLAAMRYLRTPSRVDLVVMGLMLGAVGLAVPTAVMAGVLIWAFVAAQTRQFPLIVGVPLIAIVATLPTILIGLR